MTTIKVTEVKLGDIQESKHSSNIAQSNEQMFDCEFPKDEGIAIEQNSNQGSAEKTYTKTGKNEYGDEIVETYDANTNTLISRKTLLYNGGYAIETFKPGTKIITKKETYTNKNKLEQLTEFHNTTPYKISKETNYRDGEILAEYYYDNNEENNHTRTLYHYKNGNIELKFLGYGSEDIVIGETHYYPDNTIKSDIQENTQKGYGYIQKLYRKDGTVFSEGEYQDIKARNVINSTQYTRSGAIGEKTYTDTDGNIIQERYSSKGLLYVKNKLDSDKKLCERTVYNDDQSVYFTLKYDSNGNVVDYKKFKNTDNPEHDKFESKKLNGKVDTKYNQGYSGICYFAGTIKSMLLTGEGQKIIDKAYDYDFETETATIEFKGYNKTYTISKKEIIEAMGRLGTGDPDFTAQALGWEKLVIETKGRHVDGGQSEDVFFALTGQKATSNVMDDWQVTLPITNQDLNNLQNMLKQGNVSITVATPQMSVDTEMTDEDHKKDIINNHLYTVVNITDENVKVFDPRTGKYNTYSREIFMQKFERYTVFDYKTMKK